jgi:hypothetical protein
MWLLPTECQMTPILIPAEPGYTLLLLNGASLYTTYPIIAWKVDTSGDSDPVTPVGMCEEGDWVKVVETPEGMIWDRGGGVYEDRYKYLNWLRQPITPPAL